jgi:hypothetical protein
VSSHSLSITLGEAEAWIAQHADIFAEYGFSAEIVGSVRVKGRSEKDLDILMHAEDARDLEDQLELFYHEVAQKLGLDVCDTPLECGTHRGWFFVNSEAPNGWTVEFYFFEDA